MKNNAQRIWKVIGSIVLIIAGILLGFTACTSTGGINTSTATKIVSSSEAPKPFTAEEISKALKDDGLPIGVVQVTTESNDDNHLMGRPNQYISKVCFSDTRIKQCEGTDLVGGSVETFNNKEDLMARKEYCESIQKKIPAMQQYFVVNGNYLLRLDKEITPTQASKYKEAFMKIK